MAKLKPNFDKVNTVHLLDELDDLEEKIEQSIEIQTVENTLNTVVKEYTMPEKLTDIKQEIQFLSEEISKNIWLIGERLNHINSNKLFIDDGYNSFSAFVEKEIHYTRQTAYKFIDIYKNFSFDASRRHGSKLMPLLRIHDSEKRNDLLNRMENEGLTKKEIEKEVSELTGKKKVVNEKALVRSKNRTVINTKVINKEQFQNFYNDLEILVSKYDSKNIDKQKNENESVEKEEMKLYHQNGEVVLDTNNENYSITLNCLNKTSFDFVLEQLRTVFSS